MLADAHGPGIPGRVRDGGHDIGRAQGGCELLRLLTPSIDPSGGHSRNIGNELPDISGRT